MQNNGWVKIYRKFEDWEWSNKPEMVALFLHLLLLANHEDGTWRGQTVKRGQLITGLRSLEKKTGISYQKLRTCLSTLKSTHEITLKSTHQFSIITIVKYEEYQTKEKKQHTKQHTNTHEINNKQEDKEDKKNTVGEPSSPDIPELIKAFEEINPASKRFYGNTTQRDACEQLIKLYTFERVLSVISNTLPKTNKIEFLPTITTPLQLYEKWSALEAGIMRIKNKGQFNNKKRNIV